MARKKPFDPALQARLAEERQEAARMTAIGATVTTDPVGRIISARLSNPFNLLLSRNTITLDHYICATWLAETWAEWKGLDGAGERIGEAVDGGSGCSELITDRMVAAGREVYRALATLDPTSRHLAKQFMIATVEEDRPMSWRGLIQKHTGEAREIHQRTLFVTMVEALRVYRQEPRSQHRVAA